MARSHGPESPELALLAQVTQLVGTAADPRSALQPLVTLVKQQLGTDVCSVYLVDAVHNELVLEATDGLALGAVGKVRMAPGDGLTGLVAEVRAPVSVAEAFRHPRFHYFPETGEERYHSFLGVPLLLRNEVEGVLVVQTRDARKYRRDEVRMLATVAAQLAGVLMAGARVAPAKARVLPHGPFPAAGALVTDAEEAGRALPARPQVLVTGGDRASGTLEGIAAATPGSVLLVPCELSEVEHLVTAVREAARRSPIRVAPAGASEPGELARARSALASMVGPGGDVGLGATVDAPATALSVRALAAHADFFYFDTTALARSATGGRSADPFLPAVLRLLARALHAAHESSRPTFIGGGLGGCPEGWLAAAGFAADVLVVPVAALSELRALSRRVPPGAAADAARAALRTHNAAEARRRLAESIPSTLGPAST